MATDGWSLPQSSSPTATLSFMAGDHLRKRGAEKGGLPSQAGTGMGAHADGASPPQPECKSLHPGANASAGIICEQRSSRRAGSASLLSLLAPPAWRQGGESPSYLSATSAEANGSTMDPAGQGSAMAFFLTPVPPALFTSTISRSAQ